ncbi:MAG: peptidylprolyl isomerase [Aquabacterium sp.]
MNVQTLAARAVAVAVLALALPVSAQNIAVVNSKPVPKSRIEPMIKQAERSGQKVSAEQEAQLKERAVLFEIFTQEAEKRGLAASADYKSRMELARQSTLVQLLFEDYRVKNKVTDAEAKVEYDKFKGQATGTEYRARHILVEAEDEAKKLIAQIKAGGSFEELAKKHSKDPGSGQNGGDLDYAKADAYVPEFTQAMQKLKKGEMTEAPVKSQFGFHIIKLEDTREAQFPDFESVKAQIVQRLEQTKLQKFQEDVRKAAKTDFKFAQ